MRRWLSYLIIACVILSFTCNNIIFVTKAETKTVRIAISDEENIVIDRIIYAAVQRLGYEVVVADLGMKTAVISVDNGENDLLAVQALGIEEQYPNLIPVRVPISYVRMAAYTAEGKELTLDCWDDLIGLRVVYHPRNIHVENHIPSGAIKVPVNNDKQLFQTLKDGKADVLVVPVPELTEKVAAPGTVFCGLLETVTTYSFVNVALPELAVQLEEEYLKMLADGTISRIKSNQKEADDNSQMVLHISSYSAEMRWESRVIAGVLDVLQSHENVMYYNLSLNLRRLTNVEAQHELMIRAIHTTCTERAPDVIVVSDNSALEFVTEHYMALFSGIPVIYCGINHYTPDMIYGLEKYVTGVVETASNLDTVEEMLRLYPHTKNIYLLNDYSITGRMSRQAMEEDFASLNSPVNLVYNADVPWQQVVDEIRALGNDTLVLCGTYYTDGIGKYFTELELSKLLAQELSNPIFCLSIAYVGDGVMLGGRVVDGYRQGYEAALLAVDVLHGTAIENLLIDDSADKMNVWTFDHEAAQRVGLKVSQLRADHEAVNKALSLMESNPVEATVLISCLVFSLMLALVCVFFIVTLQRKNTSLLEAQKNLHTAEELLRKDEEIRRSQADLGTLLNTAMQPVLVVDMKTGALLFVNDAYVHSFAFESQADALQHTIEDISLPMQSGGESAAVLIARNHENIREHGGIAPFEWTFLSRSGQRIECRVIISIIRFSERAAYAAIIQDITADKQKTDMLQTAARLEREANALKSQFVVNMSHELRTPMNAIIGLSQVALRKGFEQDAHEMFFKVNRSAKLLLELINDVLDFSKIEANKAELAIDSFDLEQMLSDALMVAAPRIESKPVDLALSVDAGLPKRLLGDKTRIWQVLKNILDNSAKFTEEGSISLSVFPASQQPADGRASIAFCITDTGIGMTQEELNRLYTPFEQFHVARNAATGTGLGMSITHQLVQLMGGSIEVQSVPEQGTQTTVILPLAVPPDAPSILSAIAKMDLTGTHIISAGADASTCEALRIIAQAMNAKLTCAATVEEAQQAKDDPETTLLVAELALVRGVTIPLDKRARKGLLLVPGYHTPVAPSEIVAMGFDAALEKPLLLENTAQVMYNVVHQLQDYMQEKHASTYPHAAVLLVEDNLINQEVAISMLEFFDIHPVVAANGQEAIDVLNQRPFDLVFMDLIMPVMDGHKATQIIRASSGAYRDVPIVAMTANVVKEEIELCFENGMNDHIGKPIAFAELEKQLKKWLKG